MAIWLPAYAAVLSRLPQGALFPVGAVVVQLALVLATLLLPEQVRLWPPTCGFGYWDEAHQFWRAMLPLPYLWLILAGRDLRR
ncbi:hypothetical protein AB0K12_37460 [Nonomuraea sp. NPDC049419]|uniref:hypothetical protein n=1 Tax=Nonomuraea sp. NPDC049419 TaxID=3155772 RepID=UPI00342ABF41